MSIPLEYSKRFYDGQSVSGADIDTNFQSIKSYVEGATIGRENFRRNAGITNDQKVNYRSIFSQSWTVKSMKQTNADDNAYKGIIAIEHYSQHQRLAPDLSSADGAISERTSYKGKGLSLNVIQGSYWGCSVAGAYTAGDIISTQAPGDVLTLTLRYRKLLSQVATTVDYAFTAYNKTTFYQALTGLDDLDYIEVDLRWQSPNVHGERILYHPYVSIWGKMPHCS